jgi:hypothetical protein
LGLGSRRSAGTIIVDASADDVFEAQAASWADVALHVRLDDDVKGLANGKVAGVITGLRRNSSEHIVIADDDARLSHGWRLAASPTAAAFSTARPRRIDFC